MSIRESNNRINYKIRPAVHSDLDPIITTGKQIGFYQYKYLNHVMINIDGAGILVAEDINNGEFLGMCSGVNLSHDLAFIGQYGVRPEFRGQGIGSALWRAVLDHIGPERNIGLYARPEMAGKYRRSGFPVVPDKKLHCFTGEPKTNQLIQSVDGVSLVSIDNDNIDDVLQYDKQVCDGIDRRSLIQLLPTAPELANAVALDQCGRVVGYGVLCRSSTDRPMIEGLYADNQSIAEVLIEKLCRLLSVTESDDMLYYCWDSNHISISIAKKLGLQWLRSDPILFSKSVVEGDLNKIFCVSSRAFYPF